MKNKATSNLKLYEVLKKIGLQSKVGIDLRDGPFSTDIGIVNLHPPKKTHWVCHLNENSFDSYGCAPPKKLSKFIIKQNGHCLCSEYKIQGMTNKRDSYCGSYNYYILLFKKLIGIDFKSAVLKLYYQMLKYLKWYHFMKRWLKKIIIF